MKENNNFDFPIAVLGCSKEIREYENTSNPFNYLVISVEREISLWKEM